MRFPVAVAVVLAAAILVAGCGGDDQQTDARDGADDRAVIAAGLSAEALGAESASASAAGITVTGTGMVTVRPDTAEWSFGVQTSAETAEAALGANSDAMEKVVAALKGAGISGDDLQTEQVSVYPRTSDDGLSIVGYDASNTVRATIHDLGRPAGSSTQPSRRARTRSTARASPSRIPRPSTAQPSTRRSTTPVRGPRRSPTRQESRSARRWRSWRAAGAPSPTTVVPRTRPPPRSGSSPARRTSGRPSR